MPTRTMKEKIGGACTCGCNGNMQCQQTFFVTDASMHERVQTKRGSRRSELRKQMEKESRAEGGNGQSAAPRCTECDAAKRGARTSAACSRDLALS